VRSMSREADAAAMAVATPVLENKCEDRGNVIWVLHLEDNADDQEIIRYALAQGSLSCHIVAVQTGADFESRLKNETWDVILADMTLPGFDGYKALEIARTVCANTPFIFVTGTMGEDVAVETLKHGATDYILKHKLGRLASSVRRALKEASERLRRQKADAALLRYTEALERSNEELDAFAYAASHDLKAPLRVIQNASKWLEEDLEPHLTAETREHMGLLRSRVRRMEKLLDDLLEYSRIGRETGASPSETIDAAVLVDNILAMLMPPEGFTLEVAPSLAGIEVNRMPLEAILINLISNAIKHHDKNVGRIEIFVEDIGPHYRFIIRDDGPGIPAQFHEQIFKMFQTLKPRDKVEGSGMGLALARKHVEISGGTMTLESGPGRGSTFSFTWPKKPARNQKSSEGARHSDAEMEFESLEERS
jgi:signal transduction histidine kinase